MNPFFFACIPPVLSPESPCALKCTLAFEKMMMWRRWSHFPSQRPLSTEVEAACLESFNLAPRNIRWMPFAFPDLSR